MDVRYAPCLDKLECITFDTSVLKCIYMAQVMVFVLLCHNICRGLSLCRLKTNSTKLWYSSQSMIRVHIKTSKIGYSYFIWSGSLNSICFLWIHTFNIFKTVIKLMLVYCEMYNMHTQQIQVSDTAKGLLKLQSTHNFWSFLLHLIISDITFHSVEIQRNHINKIIKRNQCKLTLN